MNMKNMLKLVDGSSKSGFKFSKKFNRFNEI